MFCSRGQGKFSFRLDLIKFQASADVFLPRGASAFPIARDGILSHLLSVGSRRRFQQVLIKYVGDGVYNGAGNPRARNW